MTTFRYSSASAQSGHRSDVALSNHEINRYAPSVMAETAHASRGDRYSFIPTIQVIDGLRLEGFEPFEVRQTRVRDLGKKEHTKHLVRLRHVSQIGARSEVPEVILVNSHDGSSSYQLMSGVFRMVCSNGLIAGDIAENVRVRHSGNVVDDVIEGATRVLQETDRVVSRIAEYKAIELTGPEQLAFANAAAVIRWDDNAPIKVERLNAVRRTEDRKSDLWTTFNRVQENLIKGGIAGLSATGRRTRTREVGGVNENVKLNKALWTLADTMAALKLDKATDEFVGRYEHSFH